MSVWTRACAVTMLRKHAVPLLLHKHRCKAMLIGAAASLIIRLVLRFCFADHNTTSTLWQRVLERDQVDPVARCALGGFALLACLHALQMAVSRGGVRRRVLLLVIAWDVLCFSTLLFEMLALTSRIGSTSWLGVTRSPGETVLVQQKTAKAVLLIIAPGLTLTLYEDCAAIGMGLSRRSVSKGNVQRVFSPFVVGCSVLTGCLWVSSHLLISAVQRNVAYALAAPLLIVAYVIMLTVVYPNLRNFANSYFRTPTLPYLQVQLTTVLVATDILDFLCLTRPELLHYVMACSHVILLSYSVAWAAILSYSSAVGDEAARLRAEKDRIEADLDAHKTLVQAKEATEVARQRFMRYVFHEVRVPFNSIDMGLGLLVDEESDNMSPEGKATLELLLRASASMKVIINDTLDWAKVESGAFQCFFGPTKVRDLVQGTVLSLTPFAGDPDTRVRLELRTDPRIPTWLLADKVRLQQVLANLVSNAVKFAPHDGSGVVTIQVTAVPDAPELCDESGVLHLPSTAMQRDMVVDLQGTYWRNGDSTQDMHSVSNATLVTDTVESGGVTAGVGPGSASLLSAPSASGAGIPGTSLQVSKAIAAQKERRPSHYAVIDIGEKVGSGQSGSSFIRSHVPAHGQDVHESAQPGARRSAPQRSGGAGVGKEGFSMTAALANARGRAASACAAVSRRTRQMRGHLIRGVSCAKQWRADGDRAYTQKPPSDSFVVPPHHHTPGYGPTAAPSPTTLVHVGCHAPSPSTVMGNMPSHAHGAPSPAPITTPRPSPGMTVGSTSVGRPRSTTAAASMRFFSSPVAAGSVPSTSTTLPAFNQQHALGHSLGQGHAQSALSQTSQHVGQGQGAGGAHASPALGVSNSKAGEGTTCATGDGGASANGGRVHTCDEAESTCPIGFLKAHAVDSAEALSLGRCIGCVPPLCALVAPASILQTLDSTSHSFARPIPPEGAEGEQATSPQNATQRAERLREPLSSSAGAAAAIALDTAPSVPRVPALSGDPNENLDLSAVPHCTLLISVKDNGEGIPTADIPMLFQAFRQLDAGLQYKGKGTGLGLAICHEIITTHGGRVGVRSTGVQGQGAEFMVALRLPILTSGGTSAYTNRGESTSEAMDSARSSALGSQRAVQAAAGSASNGSASSSLSAPGSSGGSQSPTLRISRVLVPALCMASLRRPDTGLGIQDSATEVLPQAANVQPSSRHKGFKSQRRLSWHPSSTSSVDTTSRDAGGGTVTTTQKREHGVSHDAVTTTGSARLRKIRTDGSVLTLDTGDHSGAQHTSSLSPPTGEGGLPVSTVPQQTMPPVAIRSALKQSMPVPHDLIVAHTSQPVVSVRERQCMEEQLLLPGRVPSPTGCSQGGQRAQAQLSENEEEEDLYMAVGKVQKRGKAHLRSTDTFSSAWATPTTVPPAVDLGRRSGLSSIASAVVSTHNSYSPSSNSRGNSNDSRGKERRGSMHSTPPEPCRAAASEPAEEHLHRGQGGAVSRPRTADAQQGPLQPEAMSCIAQKGGLNGITRHFTFHPAGVHDDESVGAAVHDALARRAAAMVHAAQAARTPHHGPRHAGPWGDPLSPMAAPAGTRDSAMSRAPRNSTDGPCSSARGPLTLGSPPLGPRTGAGTPSPQYAVAPCLSAEAAALESSSKLSPAFPGAPVLAMPVRSPGFSQGSGWLSAAAMSISPAKAQAETARSSAAKQGSLSPEADLRVGLHVPLQRSASMRVQGLLGDAARVRSISSRQLLPSQPGLSTIQESLPQAAALIVPTVSPRPLVPALLLHTEAAVTEAPAAPAGKRPLRILVVDDVSDNRKLLVRSLRARLKAYAKKEAATVSSLPVDIEGVELREASDGHEAVAAVLDVQAAWVETAAQAGGCLDPRITAWPLSVPINIASLHSFDLITMDAEMPTMSGFVATRLLRKAGYRGAIFGCTGNALDEDQRLFRSAGVDSVFIKPVAVAELAAAIVAACARAQ